MNKPNVSYWQSFKEFAIYAKSERVSFLIALTCIVISTMTMVATPYVIALAVDQTIAHQDAALLARMIAVLAGLYAVTLVTQYIQTRFMGQSSQRVLFNVRAAIFSKLQRLPMTYFGTAKQGDIIARVNGDTERIGLFLSEGIIRFTNVLLSLIAISAIMLALNIPMAIATFAACFIILVATRLSANWIRIVNKRSLEASGDLAAITQEILQNFKVIVAYHRQEYMQKAFEERNVENRRATEKAQIASSIFTPIYRFASNSAQILVLIMGGILVSQGQATIGILIAFIAYAQRFYEPLIMLATFWAQLQSAIAAWNRVREILTYNQD